MEIIISDMEMPKSCLDCPCHDGEYGCCNITKNYIGLYDNSRPQDCPLKEAEPAVHAHWELVGQTYNSYEHKCSRCHRAVFTSSAVKIENINAVYPYCHCGAKMDEEENEK